MKANIPGVVPLKAGPEEYSILFEQSPIGALVLEDLVSRFTGKVFVEGGIEGERKTTFNLGKREVIEYILRQINHAHGVDLPQPEVETEQGE